MRLLKLSGLLILSLFLASCGEDKGDLDMNFKLAYQGEPLVMFQDYTYPTGETFMLSRVSFYLSDVSLGEEMILEEEYIDLTESHASDSGANAGLTYKVADIASDDYPNIKIGIGVTAEDNAMQPADFPTDNALSRSGEYWTGWQSYVFYKIEGMIDLDGDGTKEQAISLHIGGDEVYTSLRFDKPITIASEQDASVTFKLDLENVFEDAGDIYNIQEFAQIASKANHIDQMRILMNNTAKNLTVQ